MKKITSISRKLLYVVLFFILVIAGSHTSAQTTAFKTIKLPVYTIKVEELKSLFIKGKRSKIVTNLSIENTDLDLNKKTSLKLFSFSKRQVLGGSKKFEKEQLAILFEEQAESDFQSFAITNSEIRIADLKSALPGDTALSYGLVFLVPGLVADGSFFKEKQGYALTFTVMYLSTKYTYLLDELYNKKKEKPGGSDKEAERTVVNSLTAVKTLNPCPPARPAEYNKL